MAPIFARRRASSWPFHSIAFAPACASILAAAGLFSAGCATAPSASAKRGAPTRAPRTSSPSRAASPLRAEMLAELAEPSSAERAEPGSVARAVAEGAAESSKAVAEVREARGMPTSAPGAFASFPPVGFKPVPVLGALKEPEAQAGGPELKRLSRLSSSSVELSTAADAPLIFDIPIAYNDRVKRWISYFQTTGRSSFKRWLERSSRFLPFILAELQAAGLPQDLAYVAMIESGFQPDVKSHARAVGLWQFMARTGQRYGLRVSWWIDERRDPEKATRAAIEYMTDLYKMFGSWYLVAASYNMGEAGVARLLKRHGTNDFWKLADAGALPEETTNYVPKILAATLISKAPALYGFRDLNPTAPLSYDWFVAPAGTDLGHLAAHLGVSERHMEELNPELLQGFVPSEARRHRIRVPKGAVVAAADFAKKIGSPVALHD